MPKPLRIGSTARRVRNLKAGRLKTRVPAYPAPPIELAGKWVAWGKDHQIIAANESLIELKNFVESRGLREVTFQFLRELEPTQTH